LQRYEDFYNCAIPKNGGFDEYLEMRNKMGENRYEKRKSLLKNFLFYEVSSGVEPLYTVLQTVT
jgi:hypothetical protein